MLEEEADGDEDVTRGAKRVKMANNNNNRIPVPTFKADNYEMYESQVEVWAEVCGIDKTKQASVLWLTLPDDHASDIKAKIYNEIKAELKTETGVTKFLEVMAKAFKPAEQNQVLKVFLEFFVNMKRGSNEKIMEFITRFDKTANVAKKRGMDMSQTILGLKLIHDSGLSDSQRNMVLVEINFEKKDDVYEKAKLGLNKYMAGVDGGGKDEKGIKLEAEYVTEEEEALLAASIEVLEDGEAEEAVEQAGRGVGAGALAAVEAVPGAAGEEPVQAATLAAGTVAAAPRAA